MKSSKLVIVTPSVVIIALLFYFGYIVIASVCLILLGIFLAFKLTKVTKDYSELSKNIPNRFFNNEEYVFLCNAEIKPSTTLFSPLNERVEQYQNRGWKIKVHKEALDIYGKPLDENQRSIWGRRERVMNGNRLVSPQIPMELDDMYMSDEFNNKLDRILAMPPSEYKSYKKKVLHI